LIAIVLIDCTLGKAFDSKRNNEDIFQKDLRGMQRAKEMLSSDRANFYTNPRKSETNDSSAFKQFSVPIPNDLPASTMSSFLSQLTAVPTSSFSHFHVPMNATSTATGITSFNDATIAQVSATTATTTATMTQVPATATTNAPKISDRQVQTRSPSILHPAKKAANNATLNLLLPFNQDNSAIMKSSLLLLRNYARPAITTATNATFSLQLIVESFSTGAKHIFEDAFNCANKSSKFAVVSQAMVPSMTIGNNSNGNVKPQKLIVIYSKRSLHFREDCGIFCEG
jgi:hypothetical protein